MHRYWPTSDMHWCVPMPALAMFVDFLIRFLFVNGAISMDDPSSFQNTPNRGTGMNDALNRPSHPGLFCHGLLHFYQRRQILREVASLVYLKSKPFPKSWRSQFQLLININLICLQEFLKQGKSICYQICKLTWQPHFTDSFQTLINQLFVSSYSGVVECWKAFMGSYGHCES